MSLQTTYSGAKCEPYYQPENAHAEAVKLDVSLTLVKGTILAEKAGTNEITKLTITGGPTGGTFTITYGGQTTGAIPYNAGPEDIQAALEALSNILAGEVRVYGGNLPGGIVYIEWRGTLADQNITPPTTTDSLTGGSTPATAVNTTRGGATGSSGTFAAYDSSATNGLQFAKRILVYDAATDSDGNVTLGGQSTSEMGDTQLSAPAYYCGHFKKGDLTGFDEQARQQLADVGIFIHD